MNKRLRIGRLVANVALTVMTCSGVEAFAAPIVFYGADAGVGAGGAHPVSLAAQTAFNAALGSSFLATFEGLAMSLNPTGVAIGGGATLTVTGNDFGGLTNLNQATNLGYNTTTGGSEFLQLGPPFSATGSVTARFDFTTGVNAFGAYFTGTETGFPPNITLSFNDGTSQTLTLTKTPTGGGILFFGFEDIGASITSITISAAGDTSSGRDVFGIDDVRFGRTAVPEPQTVGLLGIGLLGVVATARQRRRARM